MKLGGESRWVRREWQCSRKSYLSVTSPISFSRGSSGNNSATGSSVPGTKGDKGLRIETWNAGWIRYMIPCWELEEEGDLIYLPLDGEGTYIYIVGTQLMAGMQIPVREPDFISWAIEVRPAGICKGLVSPHCLLEVDMGWVPDSLARPELVVHSWNVKRFFHPGEQRGLVAEYAVQRCESRGGLPEGVLCILGPGKETVPDTSEFPESSAQSGHWFGGGIRRTGLQRCLGA